MKADIANHELQLRLEITTLKPFPKTGRLMVWVGFYDFPMIDNTRLSEDQRCAVVLDNFCEDAECTAEITLVYFPDLALASRRGFSAKT